MDTADKFRNIQVSTTQNFSVPPNAKFFHDIPRLSLLTFQPVKAEFDIKIEEHVIEANDYLMSLLFYPAACILMLLITILITGVVSCCMCCRPPSETKSSSLKSRKFFIGLFATFIVILCVVGGYGNYQCAVGVEDLSQSSNNITLHVQSIQNEVVDCGNKLDSTTRSLELLESIVDLMSPSSADVEKRDISNVTTTVRALKSKLDQTSTWRVFNHRQDMSVLDELVSQLEFIRVVSTYSLLGFCGFVAFVVLLSVMCSSEVFLMIGAVTGIFGLISAFMIAAWYLTYAMGISDFCMDPYSIIANQTDFSQTDMAYFLHCPSDNTRNPYHSDLENLYTDYTSGKSEISRLANAQSSPPEAFTLATDLVIRNFDAVQESLRVTRDKADCEVVHRNYVSGLNAICYTYLEGIDFVFGSGFLVAMCMFILVLLSACTWGQMDRNSEYCASSYDPLEDPYRRTGGRHTYGMYASSEQPRAAQRNYARLPVGGDGAGHHQHQPPPSYHI